MGTNAPRPYKDYYDETKKYPEIPKPPLMVIHKEGSGAEFCPKCYSTVERIWKIIRTFPFIKITRKCIHPECDYRR